MCADFHEFWGKDKKKALHLKKCANFFEFGGETTKDISKTVLAPKFWGDNQYLGSLRPQTALQWHKACYFFWGTFHAWGAQFLFGRGDTSSNLGGTSSDLGGTAPECLPWRWAYCKFTAIYRTVTIAFSLKRCCLKSVLLKK